MLDANDLAAFVDVCRQVLADRAGSAPLRAAAPGNDGVDDALWKLAVELGWTGLLLPPEVGGGGCDLRELGALAEEIGAHLAPTAIVSHLLASHLLHLSGADDEMLAHLASGELRATAAVLDAAGRADRLDVRYELAVGGWELSGRSGVVADAARADILVVGADGPEGPGLFGVSVSDDVEVDDAPMLDLSRRFASVRLGGALVPARFGDRDLVARATRLVAWAATVDAVGAARTALELTVAHAKERHQFGQPLGAFQAVKHRLADSHLGIVATRAALRQAAATATATANIGGDAAGEAIAAAVAFGKDACASTAAAAVQVHGGMGFTWDNDSHLLLRRIKLDQVLGGSAEHHARWLGERRRTSMATIR